MIEQETLKKHLYFHDNGREKCTLCSESIPKEIQRISWSVQARMSIRFVRLCAFCILRLSVYVDKQAVEEWKKSLLLKQI